MTYDFSMMVLIVSKRAEELNRTLLFSVKCDQTTLLSESTNTFPILAMLVPLKGLPLI